MGGMSLLLNRYEWIENENESGNFIIYINYILMFCLKYVKCLKFKNIKFNCYYIVKLNKN